MTCTAVPTPADSPMTAYPPITRCSRCGALETAHELARDGRTRTVRLGQTAGSADNERCAGFVAGEAVELVDAGELRRRLTAVEALHYQQFAHCAACSDRVIVRGRADELSPIENRGRLIPWPCPTVLAARGDS